MSDKTKAIVVGVEPEAGLGGALCTRLAREGLRVFVAGRTPEKVEAVVRVIQNAGDRDPLLEVLRHVGPGESVPAFDRQDDAG